MSDTEQAELLPGRLLQTPGPAASVPNFSDVCIHDERLTTALAPEAKLVCLYDGTLHGEGPVWDPREERLLWSDVPNRRLLSWRFDGHVEVAIDATYFMNGNARLPNGDFVHCEHGRRCISRSDGASDPVPIVTHYEGRRLNSPNNVAIAPDGAVWFSDPTFGILMPSQGSVAAPELDHRSVYRFEPSTGRLTRMADFEQPNGVAFSSDGATLYVSDTALSLGEIPHAGHGSTRHVESFQVGADGLLSDRRLFCRTDHGYPDGFTVDERGWFWTTAGDGVHVFAEDGTRLGFISLMETPANCAFGGADGRRLFKAATTKLFAIDLLR